MSRHIAIAFVLTVLGAALALPYSAIALGPQNAYEGRPLPEAARQLIWRKACDIPQAEAQGDSCQSGVCGFARADGTAFKPQLAAWMDLVGVQWALGPNALQPALVEAKMAKGSEIDGDARLALAVVSGLAVDVKSDDNIMQLNPMMVRWAARELLPPADAVMCGKTAKEFYLASFSGPTRVMVDVYAQLKARGALIGVKEAELANNFDARRGRYATMCEAIGKKSKNQEETWPRTTSCWWWLRRAATGGTDELALLFTKALRLYDDEAYENYKRVLPKEPKTAPQR